MNIGPPGQKTHPDGVKWKHIQTVPKWKSVFSWKTGVEINNTRQQLFLIIKINFLKIICKKDDQYTVILLFADRPELPYEVDFWRNRFAQNIGCQTSFRFYFWNVILGVSEEISESL